MAATTRTPIDRTITSSDSWGGGGGGGEGERVVSICSQYAANVILTVH